MSVLRYGLIFFNHIRQVCHFLDNGSLKEKYYLQVGQLYSTCARPAMAKIDIHTLQLAVYNFLAYFSKEL